MAGFSLERTYQGSFNLEPSAGCWPLPPKDRATGTQGCARVHLCELPPLDMAIKHADVAACWQGAVQMRSTMLFVVAALDPGVRIGRPVNYTCLAGS